HVVQHVLVALPLARVVEHAKRDVRIDLGIDVVVLRREIGVVLEQRGAVVEGERDFVLRFVGHQVFRVFLTIWRRTPIPLKGGFGLVPRGSARSLVEAGRSFFWWCSRSCFFRYFSSQPVTSAM